NLYNKKIRVTFIKYLRPEEKFDSIDALISQMNQDKITVLDIINNKNMLK
ncbi:MAG TPA: riboflavin biosynthesis protein RibF, partial [Acholeplasmataceae bacterium]|nr:riboflavin biosynthesis protein RibF [Acholeplasmataceae bacterium]